MTQYPSELVCLVADKDMEQTILGLLSRGPSLGIRSSLSYQIFIHPLRDPGCFNDGPRFLRQFVRQFQYALVLFDYEGSGQENISPDILETRCEQQLTSNGWEDRSRVILLKPELEAWVWSSSPNVDECLNWSQRNPDLRTWMRQQKLLGPDEIKPQRPKEALERALQEVRKPRSSAIYRQLASTVSLEGSPDPSFRRLKTTLQTWFPKYS
jgi:hypothetical protein